MNNRTVQFCLLILLVIMCSEGFDKNNKLWNNKSAENIIQIKGSTVLCLFLGICSASFHHVSAAKPSLDIVHQWSQLEFDYPSQAERQADIDTQVFIPGKPAPIDVDVFYSPDSNKNSEIFVTIPRFQSGVPVTLGTVSNQMINGNPVIVPYPSWEWHRNPQNCASNRIVSVYRVAIDECDRLWVLDTGRLLESQTCPPQILAFDLRTKQLVHKFEIPSNLIESRSILVTPIIDIRDNQCGNTFVYVADCQTYSIIVHDVKAGTAWKATDKTMYPYPDYGTFSIKGDSFDLMDGVLGMALEPHHPGKDRRLFYHAMSSPTENFVYTSHLRNESLFKHDPTSSPEIFHTYRGQRITQSAAEAIDKYGVMFYGLMSETKIACWNTNGEYGDRMSTDVVASDPVTLQFASGIKVVKNRKHILEVWIMTSRFQKVATGTINPRETNFRILAGKRDDLLFGTSCKGKKFIGSSGGGYMDTGSQLCTRLFDYQTRRTLPPKTPCTYLVAGIV